MWQPSSGVLRAILTRFTPCQLYQTALLSWLCLSAFLCFRIDEVLNHLNGRKHTITVTRLFIAHRAAGPLRIPMLVCRLRHVLAAFGIAEHQSTIDRINDLSKLVLHFLSCQFGALAILSDPVQPLQRIFEPLRLVIGFRPLATIEFPEARSSICTGGPI